MHIDSDDFYNPPYFSAREAAAWLKYHDSQDRFEQLCCFWITSLDSFFSFSIDDLSVSAFRMEPGRVEICISRNSKRRRMQPC
jgi:hypothetical protein